MTEKVPGHTFSWENLGGSPVISEDQCSCGWRGPLNYANTREAAVGSYYDKHIADLATKDELGQP